MNREIKFRAWSKTYKRFVQNFCIFNDNNGTHISDRSQTHDLSEQMIIEQYTGLKDKNGKEIYEGDILKDKSVVEFGCEELLFGTSGDYNLEYKTTGFYMRGFFNEPLRYPEDMEVIGNIFENPELSETK